MDKKALIGVGIAVVVMLGSFVLMTKGLMAKIRERKTIFPSPSQAPATTAKPTIKTQKQTAPTKKVVPTVSFNFSFGNFDDWDKNWNNALKEFQEESQRKMDEFDKEAEESWEEFRLLYGPTP